MRIGNFAIKCLIYVVFINYSATDQARSIKFDLILKIKILKFDLI